VYRQKKVAVAFDQVSFPVAVKETVLDLGMVDVNALYFLDLPVVIDTAALSFSYLVSVAQTGD